VPTVSRARTVRAAPQEVWRVLSDPERLPGWWPGVQRVEEATPQAWTTVLSSPRGKTVRADYTLVDVEHERRLVWRHEVEESPFERILRESSTELTLDPEGPDATQVALTTRHRSRGFARLGYLQLRLATARQLEGALDGLERLVGEGG
jgi:uncharacterized protein YndB with AHSA1/START domain